MICKAEKAVPSIKIELHLGNEEENEMYNVKTSSKQVESDENDNWHAGN